MKLIYLLSIFTSLYSSEIFYYENNNKIYLEPVTIISKRDLSDIKYYKNPNNQILGLRNQILLKLNSDINTTNLLSKYDITLEKNLNNFLYLIKVNNINDIFSISNNLNLEINVNYAQPNFIRKKVKR